VSDEIAKQYLSEIKGLKDSGNELQRECETHRLLTKKLSEQISNVQGELDYLKSQLALMKNSISWKITRPLRKIRRFQMQINGHLKSNITKKKRLRKIAYDHAPKISIITPVFNPRESDFRQMLASIMAQTYQNWELCLADDASSASHVKRLIEEFGSKEPRVKVTFRATRGHISEASNSAIDLASGEFLALVDHDDLLEPTALEEVARCLKTCPDVDIVYTDEDTVLPDGTLGAPYLKPTWSPDLFLSNMYTCHLGVYRRSLVEEVGKFRSGFEGSQDYDLVLRLTERVRKICHLPEVLYHWRCSPTSTALNLGNKEYAFEAGKRALEEALSRRGEIGSVKHVPGYPGHYRVHYEPGSSYSVAVFLGGNPSGGQVECLSSLQAPNGPITEIYFQDETWSKNGLPDNRLVQYAKAEILFFLNASLRPKDPGWLREMSSYAKRPQVGVVAGTWTNIAGKIVHSGLILNTAGLWSLSHLGYPCDDIGYFGRLIDISNYSAVGYEGLMVEKRKFLEVHGFDENLHDAKGVDLCLKLLSKGYYNVVLPHIRFHWTDDGRMPSLPENVGDCFSQKWREITDSDPFYHPGFNRKEGLFKPDTSAFSNFVPRCTLVANRAK
jgi:glycosyltransferase involved in cell wall biosynthesis